MRQLLRFLTVLCIALNAVFGGQEQPLPLVSEKERIQGFRNGAVLAKPKPEHLQTLAADEAREGVRVRTVFAGLGHLRVIDVDASETIEAAIARLEATGRYEFVEPDYILQADATPNDPHFSSQWALNNTGQFSGYKPGADIDAPAGWDTMRDASNVIVAVIDSGARLDHQDIAPNLWRNPTPTIGDVHGISILRGISSADLSDSDGHGTHVAGIIGAAGNNGVGTSGVAWKVQLMILKNWTQDNFLLSDSAALVDYAVAHGAHVINCSFGSIVNSQTLQLAITAARQAGVIVVCSAGNEGTDSDVTPRYPANVLLDNIVAVANSTGTDQLHSSSCFGFNVDLAAPGSNIVSTSHTSNTGIVAKTGTSMAAPMVTGALAILKARFPTDTYRQLINRLLRGAEPVADLAGYTITGGRLNLERALSASDAPFNDDLANAARIFGSRLTLRTSNGYATLEPNEPAHLGGATHSIWYRWTATKSSEHMITTFSSVGDTVLEVYSATSPNFSGLSLIASNDNIGSGGTSQVTVPVVAGSTYYIAIATKWNQPGYTQLQVRALVENDNFANAIALTGESAQHTNSNANGTFQTGEPRILGFTPNASIWYKWKAPRDGRFQVSAFSDIIDPMLAVYTGSTLTQLTSVTASEDTNTGTAIRNTNSLCTITATANTEYYFQVASRTSATGEVTTSIIDSKWQFSSNEFVYAFTASPAIAADGTLYIGGDQLYAVTPSGDLKWTALPQSGIAYAAPAVASDGTIYQGAFDGKFRALSPDGALKWTLDFGSSNYSSISPAIGPDGIVYVHTADGRLHALNPSGTVKWSRDVAARNTFASAAVDAAGVVYQPSDNGLLYAVRSDGTEKWAYNAGSLMLATPAVDGAGNLYFGTYAKPAVMSLTNAGQLRWKTALSADSLISGSPALSADGSTLYIGTEDQRLYAIATSNGAIQWSYECADMIYFSSPAVDSNGVIYVGAYNGKLYAINPDGSLKRTWDTGASIESSPVIFGTTLYVGSNDHKLYAFDIGATVANGPWPMYRRDAARTGRAPAAIPVIVSSPASATVAPNGSLTLSVVANGTGTLTYQWSKDGVAIAGATSSSYTIANATANAAGSYTVAVTNSFGSVTSAAASVVVGEVDLPRLANLSVRSQAGSGDQTLIVGFTLSSGSGAKKPLLIRAVGPTLTAYGVPGALADPRLTIKEGATDVVSNDDWNNNPQIKAAADALYAFSLLSGLDAVMHTSLSPRDYTAQVDAKGSTGVVLVELYDGTSGHEFGAQTPRLINVSARSQVGVGADVLIAGFSISGNGSKRLLIRGIGEGLIPYGVGGTLADPRLEIYNDRDIMVAENNNWGGSVEIEDAAKSVYAFPIGRASRDAALIINLPAGRYSAVVKGVNDTTGVALVEVYELN